jgi:hypothetical protein
MYYEYMTTQYFVNNHVGFYFLYRKLNNMDGVKQQDSTPQNDSTLGFKWIKKNQLYLY